MTELTAKYRTVFGTAIGQDVLSDLLVNFCEFGVFLDPHNVEQVARHNVGTSILSRMGILSTETREQVIRALMAVVPKDKKEASK